MNEEQRRKFETELIASGFKGGINDPELIPELARLIPNHEVLRALLNECSRLERGAMLEAIRPHLSFEANSVDWYEGQTAQKFEQYEETRRRMIVGDQQFEETCKELASHAIVTLKCCECPRTADFAGTSPLGAVILARQEGWIRNRETNKERCPKCRPLGSPSRKKCPGCLRRHYAPDCRVLGKVEPGAPLIGGAKKGEMNVGTGEVN